MAMSPKTGKKKPMMNHHCMLRPLRADGPGPGAEDDRKHQRAEHQIGPAAGPGYKWLSRYKRQEHLLLPPYVRVHDSQMIPDNGSAGHLHPARNISLCAALFSVAALLSSRCAARRRAPRAYSRAPAG